MADTPNMSQIVIDELLNSEARCREDKNKMPLREIIAATVIAALRQHDPESAKVAFDIWQRNPPPISAWHSCD